MQWALLIALIVFPFPTRATAKGGDPPRPERGEARPVDKNGEVNRTPEELDRRRRKAEEKIEEAKEKGAVIDFGLDSLEGSKRFQEALEQSDGAEKAVGYQRRRLAEELRPPRSRLSPAADWKGAAHDIARFVARSSSLNVSDLIRGPLVDRPFWASGSEWQSLSPEAQLTELVVKAMEVDRRQGPKLLAIMSRALAMEYETVRHDRILGRYMKTRPRPPPVHFADLSRDTEVISLDPGTQRAVDAVAIYVSRGGHVTFDDLLEVAELPEAKASRLRREHSTDSKQAVLQLLGEVHDREAVVQRIAKRLARDYETASFSPALSRFLRSETPLSSSSEIIGRRIQSARPRASASMGSEPTPSEPSEGVP